MKKQITRISPLQTAKVFALLYFITTIPLVLLMAFVTSRAPMPNHIPMALFFIGPFIYAVFGFIFTIYGAWIYNMVAKLVGGIEYTTAES